MPVPSAITALLALLRFRLKASDSSNTLSSVIAMLTVLLVSPARKFSVPLAAV